MPLFVANPDDASATSDASSTYESTYGGSTSGESTYGSTYGGSTYTETAV